MFFTPIGKSEIFSYARHKSVRICGLRGCGVDQKFFNLGAFWTWMASFRLQPFCLWESGPDIIGRQVQVSFGGGLDVWRKENSCLSLESKHDSSLLKLLAYGWAVLVGIFFQPDGLYFFLLKLCVNSIQTTIQYEFVWRPCFFILQRNY
jgi:hypothetical protein